MTLGNMGDQGVRGLAIYCLNHACRHHTVISADDYADEIEVLSLCVAHEVQKVRRQAGGRAAHRRAFIAGLGAGLLIDPVRRLYPLIYWHPRLSEYDLANPLN